MRFAKTGSTNKELMGGNDEWTVFDRFEAEFKKLHDAEVEASKKGDVPTKVRKAAKAIAVEPSDTTPVIVKDNEFVDEFPATDDAVIDEGNTDDEDKIEEEKESLFGKTRDELDEIAVECGAADSFEDSKERFSNMTALRAAIEEARSK